MKVKNLKFALAALLAAHAAAAAAVGGIAEVAVFDRSEGRQLPVYWHEGRAWVVGRPGNEYAIRVRSRQCRQCEYGQHHWQAKIARHLALPWL